MQTTIYFGKHRGKSIERILVEDPSYFAWLKNQTNNRRVKEISCKLNNLIILEDGEKALTVKECKWCKKKANYLGIRCVRDEKEKIVDFTQNGVYCSDCLRGVEGEVYPATLNAILSLYATKEVKQELISFLLKVKGFETGERIDYDKLSEFLNKLTVEGCPQQLRLF